MSKKKENNYVYVPVEVKAESDTLFTAKKINTYQETGVFLTKCTVYLNGDKIEMEIEDKERRKAGDLFNAFYCKENNKLVFRNPSQKEKKAISAGGLLAGIIILFAIIWIGAAVYISTRIHNTKVITIFFTASFQFFFALATIGTFIEGLDRCKKVKKGTKIEGTLHSYIGERYDKYDRPGIQVTNDIKRLIPVKEFYSNEELTDFINKQRKNIISYGNEIMFFVPVVTYEWNENIKEIHLSTRYGYNSGSVKNNFWEKKPIGSKVKLAISSNGDVVENNNGIIVLMFGISLLCAIGVGLLTLIY